MPAINRLKAVLNEEGRTGKWLAAKLEKDPTTVSRWCSNRIQPSLETIDKIAQLLDINRQELLEKSK